MLSRDSVVGDALLSCVITDVLLIRVASRALTWIVSQVKQCDHPMHFLLFYVRRL